MCGGKAPRLYAYSGKQALGCSVCFFACIFVAQVDDLPNSCLDNGLCTLVTGKKRYIYTGAVKTPALRV